jgi:excisionase family DNA binding protein
MHLTGITRRTVSTPELISIQDAADFIGVHPNTIRNMIRRDQLTAYRFGLRVIRIDRQQLMRVVQS